MGETRKHLWKQRLPYVAKKRLSTMSWCVGSAMNQNIVCLPLLRMGLWLQENEMLIKKKEKDMIKKCACKHDYQDKKYGTGMRVHNPVKGPNNTVLWRCTVCTAVKG